jgi:hypothetical protein
MARLKPGNEVFTALVFLVIEIFVYGLVSIYLFAVLPSEFGVRKPWHYPISDPCKFIYKACIGKRKKGIVRAFVFEYASISL